MTARWSTDAECIRNRAGTLPPPAKPDARAWALTLTFIVGFLAGLAAHSF